MPRHTQLADDKYVQRGIEDFCHFVGNWNTTPRQSQDEYIFPARITCESQSELTASISAIDKEHYPSPLWGMQPELDRRVNLEFSPSVPVTA
jgi:hypothetical protein